MLSFIFFSLIISAFGSTFKFDTQTWDLPTPPLAFGPQKFEINGTLVVPDPSHACAPIAGNLTGSVALIDSDICSPFKKAENALNAGASAIVIRGYRDTFGLLYFYRSSGQTEVTVPVVELWAGLKPPENPQGGENVTLVPGPNPIVNFGRGVWIFYTVFYSLFVFVTLVLTGRKFYEFRKRGEYDILPSLTMGFIFITCLIRIPILIDPTGMQGVYNWGAVEAFLTLDFSFGVVSALIVAFHWDALTRKIYKEDGSHKRLKIAGFTISTILLIIEVSTSIMRGLYLPAKPFLIGKVILYGLISVPTGIYFLISGRKILKKAGGGEKIPERMKKKAKYGFGVAVCLILFPITAFLVPSPIYDSPFGYFLLRFLAAMWLNFATLLLVGIFEVKKKIDDHKGWVNTVAETKTSAEEMEVPEETSSS
jgi:hypothetical protein